MGAVDGRPVGPFAPPLLPSEELPRFLDGFLANFARLAHPRRHALNRLCPSPSILARPAMAAARTAECVYRVFMPLSSSIPHVTDRHI